MTSFVLVMPAHVTCSTGHQKIGSFIHIAVNRGRHTCGLQLHFSSSKKVAIRKTFSQCLHKKKIKD